MNDSELFESISPNEEASTSGGAAPVVLAAIGMGGASISAMAGAGWAIFNWLREDSRNGVIFNDRKNSYRETRLGGQMPQDLPFGWSWGIRDKGNWIAGGYRRVG